MLGYITFRQIFLFKKNNTAFAVSGIKWLVIVFRPMWSVS